MVKEYRKTLIRVNFQIHQICIYTLKEKKSFLKFNLFNLYWKRSDKNVIRLMTLLFEFDAAFNEKFFINFDENLSISVWSMRNTLYVYKVEMEFKCISSILLRKKCCKIHWVEIELLIPSVMRALTNSTSVVFIPVKEK